MNRFFLNENQEDLIDEIKTRLSKVLTPECKIERKGGEKKKRDTGRRKPRTESNGK